MSSQRARSLLSFLAAAVLLHSRPTDYLTHTHAVLSSPLHSQGELLFSLLMARIYISLRSDWAALPHAVQQNVEKTVGGPTLYITALWAYTSNQDVYVGNANTDR